MKLRPNKHYTTIAVYAFLVIAAIILFNEGMKNIGLVTGWVGSLFQFVQPVIYGFVFAFLLNPMLRLYDDRLLVKLSRERMPARTRRVVALILTYLSFFALVFLFFRMIIPQLMNSLDHLFDIFPAYRDALNTFYNDVMQWINDIQILGEDTGFASLLTDLRDRLLNLLPAVAESAYAYVTGLVPQLVRLTNTILNLLLGIIISIYFLYDREKLFAQAKKICNAFFSDRITTLLYDLAVESNRVFNGFIVGKIIDSAIIGVICYIGMQIMGMEFAMLISLIVGMTNVIPYFGPFIGAIPSILMLLLVSPLQALGFGIFVLVLQQFDGNILGPKILGDTTGLSALWVIFAIMLFSGLFGVLGMFIGVPLFAILYTIFKRVVAYFLTKRGKPLSTREYDSEKNPLIK